MCQFGIKKRCGTPVSNPTITCKSWQTRLHNMLVLVCALSMYLPEVLNCVMDFKKWQQEPLGLQMTGLVSTHWEKHANHVWRFVRRLDLGMHSGGKTWQVMSGSDAWVDLEPHPEDVIALYKESMHSTQLSQMPVLVLPHAIAHGKLGKSDLKPAPLKVLGDQEKLEYMKTAKLIEAAPWELLRGGAFLRSLVDEASLPCPVDLSFIHEHVVMTSPKTSIAPDVVGFHYAPDDVRAVAVVQRGKGKGKGRGTGKAKAKAVKAGGGANASGKGEGKAKSGLKRKPAGATDPEVPSAEDPEAIPVETQAESKGGGKAKSGLKKKPAGVTDTGVSSAEAVETIPVDSQEAREINFRDEPRVDNNLRTGCSKCRYSRRGCATCNGRAKARARGRGRG